MRNKMTSFCLRLRRFWSGGRGAGKNTPRSLQMQYSTALGLLVCLTISSHLLLMQSLALKRCENAVIEAMSEERLGAQRLITAARAVQVGTAQGGPGDPLGQLSQAIDRWSRSHRALKTPLSRRGVPAEFAAAIRRGEADYRSAVDAAQTLRRSCRSLRGESPDREKLAPLAGQCVERAERYTREMAEVNSLWGMHIGARERLLARGGLVLVSITLLALLVQAFCVFRRAMRQMTKLSDKESALAKEAEEARALANRMAITLRKTEAEVQNLALVAMGTDNVVMIIDREHQIEWVNKSFTRVTGYHLEEARGRTPESLLAGDGESSMAAEGMQAIYESEGSESEIAICSKSGQKRWLMVDCLPADDAPGVVHNYILIATDVTELKRLARQNELILKTVAEGICGVDRQGRISFVNPAATKMLGWDAAELVGKSHHETLRPSRCDHTPNPLATCPFCAALKQGRRYRAKNGVFWRKDGTSFPVEYISTPVEEQGDGIGAVVSFRDISEENVLQRQLMQAQKLESIGQLAAGIAHEINTPIQFVGDNTRFLQDSFGDLSRALAKCQVLLEAVQNDCVTEALVAEAAAAAEAADLEYLAGEIPVALEQSLEGIDRVANIVRAMKEFSHPAVGTKVASDLSRAIQSTITIARNEWKYVADVVTDFDESLPLVPCFPGELNQAILNILVNAAHAIGETLGEMANEKGTITVITRRDGDWAEIRVHDTGPGIPESCRAKIFDPFFTTKEVGKGTGQGLAVAHSVIVEQHQGTITFETEIGRGTTFVIRLPLGPETTASEEPARENADSVC